MSGFVNTAFSYGKETPFRGLGDDITTAASDTSGVNSSFFGTDSSFFGPFLGGSMITAFVLGIGIIIAFKTVLPTSRSSSSAPQKKWAAGAWRDLDYEDPNAPLFSDKELKKLLRNNRGNSALVRARRRG